MTDIAKAIVDARLQTGFTWTPTMRTIGPSSPKIWTRPWRFTAELRKQSTSPADLERIAQAKRHEDIEALRRLDGERHEPPRDHPAGNEDPGNTVITTARTAESDAWTSEKEAVETLQGIAGTSKATIIIAQLIGIAAALAGHSFRGASNASSTC